MIIHFLQVLIVIIYVKEIYINNMLGDCQYKPEGCVNYWALTLMIGVVHTFVYEAMQMWR
jgi:hypothetical protein